MIGKLKYEQVEAFAAELRKEAKKVEELATARSIQEIVDFANSVESYAKFLENMIELNRDADKAIASLVTK
jgi:3-dehydroquinate dehydratase